MRKNIAIIGLGLFWIVGSLFGGGYLMHTVPEWAEFPACATTALMILAGVGIVICGVARAAGGLGP